MRLPWNQAQKPAPAKERDQAKFSGFAEDPPDLWEFWTNDGEYVYVKEMGCTGIHFNPMSRRLDLTFETVSASTIMRHPVTVTLSFEEAQFLQWSDDPTDLSMLSASREPERARGQITDLSHGDNGTFSLQLLDLAVAFQAVSVTCLVRRGL